MNEFGSTLARPDALSILTNRYRSVFEGNVESYILSHGCPPLMLGPSPYFILSGGNQPSSHLVLLDHRRRTRDYVMFVQRPDLSKTPPLPRPTPARRPAGRMPLLGAPVDRPKPAWVRRGPVARPPQKGRASWR